LRNRKYDLIKPRGSRKRQIADRNRLSNTLWVFNGGKGANGLIAIAEALATGDEDWSMSRLTRVDEYICGSSLQKTFERLTRWVRTKNRRLPPDFGYSARTGDNCRCPLSISTATLLAHAYSSLEEALTIPALRYLIIGTLDDPGTVFS
jgi:hypothetical protein